MTLTPEIQFWIKVNKTKTCWLWTGPRSDEGYGKFRRKQWSTGSAHRISYQLLIGPIPEGLDLDHLCRVRHCVNPEHLEPVTRKENVMRGNGACARNALKTHCPQGHPLIEGNLVPSRLAQGSRACLECKRRVCRNYARNKVKQRRISD